MLLFLDEKKKDAAIHYNNSSCIGLNEFEEDYNIPKKIIAHIRRWKGGSSINLKITINFFIIFFNVFEHDYAMKMIFDNTPSDCHPEIKSFLLVLNKTKRTDHPNIDPNKTLIEDIEKELK